MTLLLHNPLIGHFSMLLLQVKNLLVSSFFVGFLFLCLFCMISFSLAGITGKIAGKVTDAEYGKFEVWTMCDDVEASYTSYSYIEGTRDCEISQENVVLAIG